MHPLLPFIQYPRSTWSQCNKTWMKRLTMTQGRLASLNWSHHSIINRSLKLIKEDLRWYAHGVIVEHKLTITQLLKFSSLHQDILLTLVWLWISITKQQMFERYCSILASACMHVAQQFRCVYWSIISRQIALSKELEEVVSQGMLWKGFPSTPGCYYTNPVYSEYILLLW